MWIFLNEGITKIQPPILTTFLRTMWKLTIAGHRLSQKKLVEGEQKTDTLSKHLQQAVDAGLIEKKREKPSTIDGIIWRSPPNEYTPLNPTHKVWIEEYQEIDDLFSYSLQKRFRKEHNNYYKKKFEVSALTNIHTERVTEADMNTHDFALSWETPLLPIHKTIIHTTQ